MPTPRRRILLAAFLTSALAGAPWAAGEGTPAVSVAAPAATPEEAKAALLDTLAKAKYKFTAPVRAAYLKWAKAQALADVQAAGKELPKEFLDWVNKDPAVEAAVYGARPQAAPMLMQLCSLWLDMGPKDAAKYKQLMLAAAVVAANEGVQPDLSPRKPMILDIPALPDTNAPLAKRDPLPTPAQTCAFLVRNQECAFNGSEDKAYKEKKLKEQKEKEKEDRKEALERKKEELKNKGKPKEKAKEPEHKAAEPKKAFSGKRKWPAFDIADAPWPILTPLLENRLPLREAEGLWQEYVQTGTVEFSEGVTTEASPFGPGSWQEMRRRETGRNDHLMTVTFKATFGQPAMMGKHYEYASPSRFFYVEKNKVYDLATDDVWAGSYAPQECEGWAYGAHPARGLRREYWQRSMTYAVNRGMKEYMDSFMALHLFTMLPEGARREHGADLLESAMAINPYNIEVAQAFGAQAQTAVDVVDACNAFGNALMSAHKTGAPRDSEYSNALLGGWIGRFSALPVPTKKDEAQKILAFLKQKHHPDAALRLRYQAVALGAENVRDQVAAVLDAHLAGARTPANCQAMAAQIRSAAASAADPAKRDAWLKDLREQMTGKEDYWMAAAVPNPYSLAPSSDKPAPHPQVTVQKMELDETASALAELMKDSPLPAEAVRREKMLAQVSGLLKKHLASKRDELACQTMACQISATADQITDKGRRDAWLKGLVPVMAGNAAYLELVTLKESTAQFADKILNDETDKAIVEALQPGGIQDSESKRWEKPLKQLVQLYKAHVYGHRTGGSCQHMAQLVAAIAGQIKDPVQKKDWLKDLYRAVYGRENYATTGGASAPHYRDPSADEIAKQLGLGAKPMPGKK